MNDEGNAARKIRKLRASRDLWKQRSAEKQQEIRQLRVTVRDLSSSRENWKTGMVQERPFSGSTWDLSADPDRSRALERVYVSPWLPCWGFSSARTACTPEAPASERAAHPSATPQDSCRLDWGLHCAGTGGGSGRTAATSSSPCPIAAAGRSSWQPAVEVLDQTAGSHNPIG